MQKRPLLCLVIAGYDVFRFIVMITILTLFAAVSNANGRSGLQSIPFLVYAAPLAIFPLMAFFLWYDNLSYRPFAFLYIAGKTIGIVAVFIWIYVNKPLSGLFPSFPFAASKDILLDIAIPVLSFIDLFSIAGIFSSCKKRDLSNLEISSDNRAAGKTS
ncbi:MAG: hypothetical protein LBV68_03410 [Spirochaetaceae bacterium]|jgi:hypothetical protein|nr:hypothetical protein [Spirochaetaceae bacterium]